MVVLVFVFKFILICFCTKKISRNWQKIALCVNMADDFVEFIEFVEYARRFREIGPRRYLRDYSDPFTKYSVQEFYARYRFTPETVKNVLVPVLVSELRKPTKRGLPFAPEVMLLITLRYFATGNFQKMDADVLNVCQQSISRIIARVSTLIASKMKTFIKFPSTREDIDTVKQKFYKIAHFPGVIGCIDCTHVKIRSPGGATSEVYRNENGYFSIKVQAVTGPNLEFSDIVARWPGSVEHSYIYNNSVVKHRLTIKELDGVILGDSEYEGTNIVTPFSSPNSTAQEDYNKSHIKTRNTAGICFDNWKRRFPCLEVGMGIKLDTVLSVICACAVLHNIAISIHEEPLNCDGNIGINDAITLDSSNSNDFSV